ncbi:MAG: Grx4 family monothiol glutaredoxin [Micavibrio sp.]
MMQQTVPNTVFERIRSDLEHNDVVLYMKGSAVFPQCGFSAAVVQILSQLGVVFKDINVLEDNDIRQGIKEFTNWPTIPQLYIKNEFVGGCDIIREMYASGELQQVLAEKGISFNQAA